jgi:hypothetical protein
LSGNSSRTLLNASVFKEEAGNSNRRGRLSTVDLHVKEACSATEEFSFIFFKKGAHLN